MIRRRQPAPPMHDSAVCGVCMATMRDPEKVLALTGPPDAPDNLTVGYFARMTGKVLCPLCIVAGWFEPYAARLLMKKVKP